MSAQVDWVAATSAQAKQRRESGMRRAVEHADAVHENWCEKAMQQLRVFVAQRQGAPFLIEDFRLWAQFRVPTPPAGGAWGPVVMRAAKSGWVRKSTETRMGKNGSPKPLWIGV